MKPTEEVVGVREFRARFSAYLREVARGGVVTIGDRHRRPVARLVPVNPAGPWEHITELADLGIVRLGCGKPGSLARVQPRRPTPTVAELVIEDRR